MNSGIYHSGIKGMKWGIRRYQNKDGSLTEAGKKRYYKDADAAGYKNESYNGRRYKNLKGGKTEGYDADPNKWVREDMERSRRLTNETTGLVNNLKIANDRASKNQSKIKMDLSKMTDAEMRTQINRALLERQYNDMFAPQKTSRGREYISKILDTAGSALAITSSALGIAMAIKELKG